MQRTVCDRLSHRITHREYTDEGFLRVPGRVARIGVQDYLARELGLDGDPNRVIRVYRPAEEVFAPASLDSYNAADVTDNHPGGLVHSENYRTVVRGVVSGPGRRDGDYVVCDLIIKDKPTIDAINSGKCELSAGYTAIYAEEPGATEDGQAYDYVQRDIKINHVAIVERARAGGQARVFDHNPENGNMTHKVILDSGRQVEVQDEATAHLVTDTIERLTKKATDAEARAEAARAVADAKAEELEALKAATSDEALKARVVAISDCLALASKIAGTPVTCDSVDLTEIKRAALAKVRPSVDWASKGDAYVAAAFDMEAEKKAEGEEDGDEENEGKASDKKMSTDTAELVAQFIQLSKDAAASKPTEDSQPSPYEAHKQRLASAYKGA